MENKTNLRLVWANPKFLKQSLVQKIWEWLTKARSFQISFPEWLRWWKTQDEKAAILKTALTNAFADYDYTTGEVNLFPSSRAENEVNKMIINETLDYYFKRHLMSEHHIKKLNKMQQKFERKQA